MSIDRKKRTVIEKIILIKNIVFAVILVFLAAIIAFTTIARISGNSPSVLGFSLYRVGTGSMEPALEVGDIILSRSVDPAELRKGDIVTFMGVSGDMAGKMVTHRVISEAYEDNGDTYIVVKGDANDRPDAPVNTKNVLGVYVGKFNVLRAFFNFFITPWGLITIIALIVAAFFGELVTLIKTILGINDEKKQSLDEIIERYQKENMKHIDRVVNTVVAEEDSKASEEKRRELRKLNGRNVRGRNHAMRVIGRNAREINRNRRLNSRGPRRKG